MPRRVFRRRVVPAAARRDGRLGRTLARLYRLGYARVDVVSARASTRCAAASSTCSRATADLPVRIEFFGDEVDAIRRFEVQSQRSTEPLDAVQIAPWLEIPARRVAAHQRAGHRAHGEPNVVSALRRLSRRRRRRPRTGLGWPTTSGATVLDYLHAESAGRARRARDAGNDRARARRRNARAAPEALMAGVDSGELDVRDDEVGEALLADVVAPYPRLNNYAGPLRHAPRADDHRRGSKPATWRGSRARWDTVRGSRRGRPSTSTAASSCSPAGAASGRRR